MYRIFVFSMSFIFFIALSNESFATLERDSRYYKSEFEKNCNSLIEILHRQKQEIIRAFDPSNPDLGTIGSNGYIMLKDLIGRVVPAPRWDLFKCVTHVPCCMTASFLRYFCLKEKRSNNYQIVPAEEEDNAFALVDAVEESNQYFLYGNKPLYDTVLVSLITKDYDKLKDGTSDFMVGYSRCKPNRLPTNFFSIYQADGRLIKEAKYVEEFVNNGGSFLRVYYRPDFVENITKGLKSASEKSETDKLKLVTIDSLKPRVTGETFSSPEMKAMVGYFKGENVTRTSVVNLDFVWGEGVNIGHEILFSLSGEEDKVVITLFEKDRQLDTLINFAEIFMSFVGKVIAKMSGDLVVGEVFAEITRLLETDNDEGNTEFLAMLRQFQQNDFVDCIDLNMMDLEKMEDGFVDGNSVPGLRVLPFKCSSEAKVHLKYRASN